MGENPCSKRTHLNLSSRFTKSTFCLFLDYNINIQSYGMSENNKSAERQNVSNEETEISGESQKHGKKKLGLIVKSTPKSSKKRKSLVDRVDEGGEIVDSTTS